MLKQFAFGMLEKIALRYFDSRLLPNPWAYGASFAAGERIPGIIEIYFRDSETFWTVDLQKSFGNRIQSGGPIDSSGARAWLQVFKFCPKDKL